MPRYKLRNALVIGVPAIPFRAREMSRHVGSTGGVQRVMDDVNRMSPEPMTVLDYARGTRAPQCFQPS